MRWLQLVFLVGCAADGDLFGGGDGLVLTFDLPDGGTATLAWEGAAKSDLREINGGLFDADTTWDPVTVGASNGTWGVRADDAFNATSHLSDLGLYCIGIADSFTAFANANEFGLRASIGIGTSDAYVQVGGVFADGDTATLFEGDGRAPAQWAGNYTECDYDALPETLSVSWTLDEDVRVTNRCLGCNLPNPDFGISIDPTISF